MQGGFIETCKGPAKETARGGGCTTYTKPASLVGHLIDAYCPRLHSGTSCAPGRGQYNAAQAPCTSFPGADSSYPSFAHGSPLLTLAGGGKVAEQAR